MKKLIIIMVLISFLTFPAQAFELKRIIGLMSSSYSSRWPEFLYSRDAESSLNPFKDNRVSFFGGAGLGLALRHSFVLELDVLYKEIGSVYAFETPYYYREKYEYRMGMISVPLLAKYRFLKISQPYLLAGVDFSFILWHRCQVFSMPEGSAVYEKIIEADLERQTEKSDLALVLGVGVEIPMNRSRVNLEVRYEIGSSNLYKGPWPSATEPYPEVRSRQFLLVLGYSIIR